MLDLDPVACKLVALLCCLTLAQKDPAVPPVIGQPGQLKP